MHGRCSYLRLQIQQDSRVLIYIEKAMSWQTRRAAGIIFLKGSCNSREHTAKGPRSGSHWSWVAAGCNFKMKDIKWALQYKNWDLSQVLPTPVSRLSSLPLATFPQNWFLDRKCRSRIWWPLLTLMLCLFLFPFLTTMSPYLCLILKILPSFHMFFILSYIDVLWH